MKFIISHEDEKHQAFLDRFRATGAEGAETFHRINVVPETVEVPLPSWFGALPDRWALIQAILQALKTALENDQPCEIYEQDCVFVEDYAQRRDQFLNSLPADWDMAYQGGQLLATRFYPLKQVEGNEEVLLAKNVHRNHAWICRNSSIPRLIEWLEEPDWPCSHCADWRIGYLQMKDDFKVYVPAKGWLCGQASGVSTLDKQEYPERWWAFN